ncbi:MAG: peptidylprolyl isomerase [Fibrobacter sp.]|jgi:peptidyl-prolyl cis-trans isomerase SurA|uniref:peptidylprolyl isomerase n=1 Tax=uncultured bacterium Ad_113_F04_contig2 TaxID=1489296 RepID=A0A0B4N0T6_9BACT|nr:putative PpiC-type peptidyl-prolyl cis-trans isomerase [uncultured bacterium Ad_113_F04_contig2]MBO4714059.1 peptidylprolyl isomerase [Fibrobacter sp.]MBR5692371.1 peptidylprolyl isomerase [Fibrobacter sp.]
MKRFEWFALAIVSLAATALAAPVLMDGVAAVVDGKPIMRSEFMNSLYQFQETPEGSAMSEDQQKDYVLERLIEEKVLLSRIDRDSIVISNSEVDQRVTAHLTQLAASQNIDLATLEKAVRTQLGISMAQYRDQLSKQVRSHMEISRVRQMHVGSISPTKKEVEAFYKAYKDSLPRQYNCVLLSHIQIPIVPDSMIVDSVKNVAEGLIDSLNLGMSFELLAKNHSQDSSAAKGGDLGYFKRGLLDPAFERALDQLKNGQYSTSPVKTNQGWHIARVLGRKEDGVRSAQILLRTIPTAKDSAAVIARADSIKAAVKTKEDFVAAAKKFSEDKSSNFRGGLLGWYQKNEMEPAYVDPVANLNVGEVSEPVLIDGAYHLFRLDDARQIRELTMEEDYGKIENLAANHLENEKLESLVKKWRQEVHVEVRMKD